MIIDLKLTFGILASLLAIACFLPYIRDILRKKTQPHIYSWFVWALLQTIGVYAQFQDGAGYGAWALTIGAGFCFLIFCLSFKSGTKNITKFDTVCLSASLLTLIIYLWKQNGLLAIILVSLIDFFGFLPTFRKGYKEPMSETLSTFVMSAVSNVLSLFALQNYTLTTILYLASLLVTNSSFAAMIFVRRKNLGRKLTGQN